jgi:hypothetical protein
MKTQTLLVLALSLCTALSVRAVNLPADSTGVISKATTGQITVDGVINAAEWGTATQYDLNRVFKGDSIVGASDCSGWFKALWNETGIYMVVNVTDNINYPKGGTNTFGADWEKDLVEIYFNTNTSALYKADGPTAYSGHGKGYYQIAANANDTVTMGGWAKTSNLKVKLTGTNYIIEYFVAWDDLKDAAGATYDPTSGKKVGFDVTVSDNDGAAVFTKNRRRIGWSNNMVAPSANENWSNMAAAGKLLFATGTGIKPVNAATFSARVQGDVLRVYNAHGAVSVYNIMGEKVITVSNLKSVKEIGLSSLPSGMYIVTDGTQAQKFIK